MSIQAKAVRMSANGGPEVLRLETVSVGQPKAGEVLIRQTAIGLNFLDVYARKGPSTNLPSGIGAEAAGVVEAVGEDVTDLKAGDRVCYAGSAPGSYATYRIMPAARVVPIPDSVSDEVAAAILMKGMTVEYLLNRCFPVQKGQQVLFYAAAGGVGLIAGQWGKHLGARMIGVAGGDDKVKLAREHGYDAVIDRKKEKIAERVRALTNDKGVAVAYDSVGKDTFEDTLASLAPRGFFVTFGATTGGPPPLEAGRLLKLGSLYYTRPTLATYTASREDLVSSAAAVFDLVSKGVLTAQIGQRYELGDATRAHRDLEAGNTKGSSIILPV